MFVMCYQKKIDEDLQWRKFHVGKFILYRNTYSDVSSVNYKIIKVDQDTNKVGEIKDLLMDIKFSYKRNLQISNLNLKMITFVRTLLR